MSLLSCRVIFLVLLSESGSKIISSQCSSSVDEKMGFLRPSRCVVFLSSTLQWLRSQMLGLDNLVEYPFLLLTRIIGLITLFYP